MSTTLDKMTAAELVTKYKTAIRNARQWNPSPDSSIEYQRAASRSISRLANLTTELESRCTKAGLSQNPDGTYRMPPFKGSVDEMAERIALLGYLLTKGGKG